MSKRILLIDDDLTVLKLISGRFQSLGYTILSTTQADMGLEMALKQQPDLIILDVMMPIVNGYNICRLLKSNEQVKHIPIVLLTGRTEEDDVKFGYEAGADAYFSKPVQMDHLINKVESLLT